VLFAAGVLLAVMAPKPAHAQRRDTSDLPRWVDGYYADFTAMTAAATSPAMDRIQGGVQ